MSFFVQTGPTARGRLAEALGGSIGQGIGQSIAQGQQRQRQLEQSGVLSKILSGEATPQEEAMLDPALRIEVEKIRGKAPAGGLTGQPTPPEVGNAINEVIRNNPEATAEELAIKMDQVGIPRAYSNSFIESRRQQETRLEERGLKEREFARKETATLKKEIVDRADAARAGIQSKESLMELIDTGNLDDPTWAAIASNLPFDLGQRLLSPETVEYRAGLVEEFKDLKNIFKGQTRTAELDILQKKLADIYLTDQQKKSVLKSRMNALQADILQEEAAQEVEDKYPNLGILQFKKKMNKLVKEKMDRVFDRIIDEHNFIFKQAETRKNIPLNPNDSEDVQILTQILKEAGGDKKKARKLATSRGYKF